MIRRRLPRLLAADERGATIVEFAFVAPPMLLLLIGGFDLGYQAYIRAMTQAALNDAARVATVENPTFSTTGADTREKIENAIEEVVQLVAKDAVVTVTQKSYFDFASVGNPEKLMTDVNGNGQFDEADGDCWQDANNNLQYDTDAGKSGKGSANDVVFYRAQVSAPRLFPVDAFLPVSGTITMTFETAVRNQPYGTQRTPVVRCAD